MYEVEIKIRRQETSTYVHFNTEDDAVREAILQTSGFYFLHPEVEFSITVWLTEPERHIILDIDKYRVEV